MSADRVDWYIPPFAARDFFRPVALRRLFDTVGRRRMISLTYALSGLSLVGVGAQFEQNLLAA